jgi:hypothetical protein
MTNRTIVFAGVALACAAAFAACVCLPCAEPPAPVPNSPDVGTSPEAAAADLDGGADAVVEDADAQASTIGDAGGGDAGAAKRGRDGACAPFGEPFRAYVIIRPISDR